MDELGEYLVKDWKEHISPYNLYDDLENEKRARLPKRLYDDPNTPGPLAILPRIRGELINEMSIVFGYFHYMRKKNTPE